jgi:hypothetical protein
MSRLSSVPQRVPSAVAEFYRVAPAMLAKLHDPHLARAVAAWLCRRDTDATMSKLVDPMRSVFPEPIMFRIQRGACKATSIEAAIPQRL